MSLPLVSCIVPTKNRAQFILGVIRCFQAQTYANKELVILDHGEDDTPNVVSTVDDSRIKYRRIQDQQYTTGEMRNMTIAQSSGNLIAHFDSDDWSGPERLRLQVALLHRYVLTGYHDMWFYDERDRKSYKWESNNPVFLLGTSFAYRRGLWENNLFKSMRVGEDYKFVKGVYRRNPTHVAICRVGQNMVARIHKGSTANKRTESSMYKPVALTALPLGFTLSL